MRRPAKHARQVYATRKGPACAAALMAVLSGAAAAQPTDDKSSVSVEALVKGGWQVAGYTSASNNRAFILFRHPNETYLVQCLAGYDVTRTPRVYAHCYELR